MTVLRFENEAEDLLHLFKNEGLAPGKEGKVAEADAEHVVVAFDDGNATLTRSVSETVSVLADPSPPPRTALPEQLVLAKERYGRNVARRSERFRTGGRNLGIRLRSLTRRCSPRSTRPRRRSSAS